MIAKVLRLGRYQTEALLGQGPTTETYRARLSESKGDDRRFVITLLRERPGQVETQMVARFVEAARRLAGLDQAGYVRVIEIGEGPGPIYAVHEFKIGVNLSQLRKQAAPTGTMDPRLVGLLARKLAERLAPLHARSQDPRVHGGLSPGNVLVTPDGEVLLLDCGLADAVRPRGDAFVGRWLFAAPEQVAGGMAVPASDLYAIGAMIHYLFTGEPPFVAQTATALREKIAAGLPAVAGMPPWLHVPMLRLLSHNPGQRPASAADAARQISAAMLAAEAGHVSRGRSIPADARERQGLVSKVAEHAVGVQAPAPNNQAAPSIAESGGQGSESVGTPAFVPFSLDETSTEDEGLLAPPDRTMASEPLVPFSLDGLSADPDKDGGEGQHRQGMSAISADDPDVGVVYDEDDEEQEHVVVGDDGKVKRRRRRRIRIPVWVRSEMARRMSRLALIPLMVLLVLVAGAGVLFHRKWTATREESARRNAELLEEVRKREMARQMPKRPEPPSLPPGHLLVKTSPAGAAVWVDGVQRGESPLTVITSPGPHRLVFTLTGYRMLRDVVDTSKGVLWEREMLATPRLDDGRVPLTVTCRSENRYPVFIDGKDSGELCPVSDLKIEPGRHSIGVFVIPQNRIWTFERELQLNRPHRVQFNY